MPIHPDYQTIIDNFIKQYGEEEGKKNYYAWLNTNKLDDTKPFPETVKWFSKLFIVPGFTQASAIKESFQWARDVIQPYKEMATGKVYKVRALHVGKSQNLNVYSEDELRLAARSLAERPLNLNHETTLSKDYFIIDADYEDGVVEALIHVPLGEIQQQIDSGVINYVSIEAKYRTEQIVDGVKPLGIVFTGLALVDEKHEPGDPLATIIKECKISQTPFTEKEEGGSVMDKTITETKEKEKVEAKPQPFGVTEVAKKIKEVEWDTAYINDLPDSAFAYVEQGDKDEQGKTVPREKRNLPYKNAQGNIDLDHLKNALARLDQTNIPEEAKNQALKVLCGAAKEMNLEFPSCMKEEILMLIEVVGKLKDESKGFTEKIKVLEEEITKLKQPKTLSETKPVGKGIVAGEDELGHRETKEVKLDIMTMKEIKVPLNVNEINEENKKT